MTPTNGPNDDQPGDAVNETGDSTADKARRSRVLGMVTAIAAVLALLIATWAVVDPTGGGDDRSSESAAETGTDAPSQEKGQPQDDADTDQDGAAGDGEEAPEAGDGQPKELTEHLLSLQRREPGDPLAKGAVDAPVVLIMYEDFRCPYCAKFASDIEPALEGYVETGKLRMEWRDYPIFGDQSLAVAKAARAASRQDRFWQFYEAAFAVGNGDGKPKFPEERIRQVAEQAGVPDLRKFDRDREDPDLMDEIAVDATEGQQIGVSSTPSFLINSQPVMGAQPVDVFVSIIEEELANS